MVLGRRGYALCRDGLSTSKHAGRTQLQSSRRAQRLLPGELMGAQRAHQGWIGERSVCGGWHAGVQHSCEARNGAQALSVLHAGLVMEVAEVNSLQPSRGMLAPAPEVGLHS